MIGSSVSKFVDQILKEGGSFEKLTFGTANLDKISTIQFTNSTRTIFGLGSDFNVNKSYIKAIYEFIDRKAYIENKENFNLKSTNGIAAHRFKFLAKKMAENELIERDAFLLHWYSKTPFKIIQNSYVNNLIDQVNELRNLGYEAIFLETTLGLKTVNITFLINSSTGGFVIGLSCSPKKDHAIAKSFTEACINLYFGGYGKNEQELVNEIENWNSISCHRSYWLYKKSMPDWVMKKGNKDTKIDKPSNKFKTKFTTLSNSPAIVVHADNPNLLPLSVGYANDDVHRILSTRIIDYPSIRDESMADNLIHPIP